MGIVHTVIVALGIFIAQQRAGRQKEFLHLHIGRQLALQAVAGIGKVGIIAEQLLDQGPAKPAGKAGRRLRPDDR